MKLPIIACIVLGVPFWVCAEESQLPPLPPGPIPAHLEFAQWKIVIRPDPPPPPPGAAGASSSASAAPGAPGTPAAAAALPAASTLPPRRTITVTKTKDYREVDVVDADGRKATLFSIGNRQYMQTGDGSWVPVVPEVGGNHFPLYTDVDFPECSWVGQQNYIAAKKSLSGRFCFVFSASVLSLSPAEVRIAQSNRVGAGHGFDLAKYMVGTTAIIDMQTLLPVTVHRAGETYSYQFLPPPVSMLAIPPAILMRAKVLQQLEQDALRRPAAS